MTNLHRILPVASVTPSAGVTSASKGNDPAHIEERNLQSILRAVCAAVIAAQPVTSYHLFHGKLRDPEMQVASAIAFPSEGSLAKKAAKLAACILFAQLALIPKYLGLTYPLANHPESFLSGLSIADVASSTIYWLSLATLWNMAKTNRNNPSTPVRPFLGAAIVVGGHQMASALFHEPWARVIDSVSTAFGLAVAFPAKKPCKLLHTSIPPLLVSGLAVPLVSYRSILAANVLSVISSVCALAPIIYEGKQS